MEDQKKIYMAASNLAGVFKMGANELQEALRLISPLPRSSKSLKRVQESLALRSKDCKIARTSSDSKKLLREILHQAHFKETKQKGKQNKQNRLFQKKKCIFRTIRRSPIHQVLLHRLLLDLAGASKCSPAVFCKVTRVLYGEVFQWEKFRRTNVKSWVVDTVAGAPFTWKAPLWSLQLAFEGL